MWIHDRDKTVNRPCAIGSSEAKYRKAMYNAVLKCGLLDPFTGDPLAWDRISTWKPTKNMDMLDYFKNGFTMLPTVDHADPDAKELDFEICSWLINGCKNNFTPDEFIGICRNVVEYCSASTKH
jgi:hypothetical protein